MSLHGIGLYSDDLDESVEGNISYVVILVCEKLSEDVDAQDSQARIGLDIENGQNGLVENRVAHILG